MNSEQRYSVPLTLQEIEALMQSLHWNIHTRQHHSSAIAVLEDVYYGCCESEVIQLSQLSTSVNNSNIIETS